MPIYSYECPKCGSKEAICPYSERDNQYCVVCGKAMKRIGLELPTIGKPSHQGGVILGDGSKLSGSFGTARKGKGWHRP